MTSVLNCLRSIVFFCVNKLHYANNIYFYYYYYYEYNNYFLILMLLSIPVSWHANEAMLPIVGA